MLVAAASDLAAFHITGRPARPSGSGTSSETAAAERTLEPHPLMEPRLLLKAGDSFFR